MYITVYVLQLNVFFFHDVEDIDNTQVIDALCCRLGTCVLHFEFDKIY